MVRTLPTTISTYGVECWILTRNIREYLDMLFKFKWVNSLWALFNVTLSISLFTTQTQQRAQHHTENLSRKARAAYSPARFSRHTVSVEWLPIFRRFARIAQYYVCVCLSTTCVWCVVLLAMMIAAVRFSIAPNVENATPKCMCGKCAPDQSSLPTRETLQTEHTSNTESDDPTTNTPKHRRTRAYQHRQ